MIDYSKTIEKIANLTYKPLLQERLDAGYYIPENLIKTFKLKRKKRPLKDIKGGMK